MVSEGERRVGNEGEMIFSGGLVGRGLMRAETRPLRTYYIKMTGGKVMIAGQRMARYSSVMVQ